MPFVQRNKKGEITGLWTVRQWEGQEELSDDHPEVVAFKERQPPLPKDVLRPLKREEAEKLRKEHETLDAEYQASNNAALARYRGWSELELAFSGLLYEVLHHPNKGSRLANVIYFSPTRLGARTTLVNDAVLQLIEEDEKVLGDLRTLWAEVFTNMRPERETKSAVAHGSRVSLSVRGKNYVRWTSPPFDHMRVGRPISKGEIPGVSADQMSRSVQQLSHLRDCVDDINRVVVAYRQTPSTFQEKLLVLREHLKALSRPSSNIQTKAGP
jgi:hypothetical protein